METEWKQGEWIQTYTGKKFFPFEPWRSEIDIRDVAHALSLKCRFNGSCSQFYSVAEHSVRVSSIVPPEHQRWGLLHDLSEAYLPDICRPIKASVWIGVSPGAVKSFREIEDDILREAASTFGLQSSFIPPEVKWADMVLLRTEARDLMPNPPEPWDLDCPVLPDRIVPVSSQDAEKLFLETFHSLFGGSC